MMVPQPAVYDELLAKNRYGAHDLPALLSPEALPVMPELARRAIQLTRMRFGSVMELFIPLYLSNYCYNRCTYCGFSMDNPYPRTRLSEEQILTEGQLLYNKGFRSVLLLTGEAPDMAGVSYIEMAIHKLRPLFPAIGIEVQPMGRGDYERLLQAGADHVALYQETYDPDVYDAVHVSGKKKNRTYRLDAIEWAAQAGFPKLSMGVLLGLSEWRQDALALGKHLAHMKKKYWRTHFSISIPRIKGQFQSFKETHAVSDANLKQLIIAFRLCFPDIGITLSTREPAELRDELIPYGITSMSAESKTSPGGYSGLDAEGQFDTADHRDVGQIMAMLQRQQLDPVFKNWDPNL